MRRRSRIRRRCRRDACRSGAEWLRWVALDTASSESGGMERLGLWVQFTSSRARKPTLRMVPGRHRELLGAAVPKLSILDAAAHGGVLGMGSEKAWRARPLRGV